MRYLSIFLILVILTACTKELVKKPDETGISEIPARYTPAYVIKENVNMRNSGSVKGQIVATLNDGDKVYVVSNENGWYRIQTENRKQGYVRSDLVGPREICKTVLARAFSDSIMPAFGGELFIDKNEPFRVIYLTLPDNYYQSTAKAVGQAKSIGDAYQHKVYAGPVEIRILKPNGKDLFKKVNLAAIGLGDIPAPILKSGRLVSLQQANKGLTLIVEQERTQSKKTFIQTARDISRLYGLPIQKVEIYFKNKSGTCLFYYLEDKDGELYREGC